MRGKTLRLYLLVGLFYLLIACLFTYPLILRLATHGFGVDEDSPYHLWHNWWLGYSLFNLHQSPLFTSYIFSPQNIPLIYDANAFVFAALTLPLQYLTHNVILASNVVFLFSFVLSGLSMFTLARFVLREKPYAKLAAVFAGFAFTFSPYVLAQASDGHTNLITTWIIPLYTLFLLKTLREEKGQTRTALITGVLAAFQLYNDFTYTSFLIIETAVILAFYLFRKSGSFNLKKVIAALFTMVKPLLTVGLTAAVLSLPILVEIAKIQKTGFRAGSPLWVQNEWAADLVSFFIPGGLSTFLRPLSYTALRGVVEGTQYLGWTVLVLAFLSVVFDIKERSFRKPNLWYLMTLTLFILSLGPFLHIFGNYQFSVINVKFPIPLPWIFLHKVPLIGEVQETTRLNPFLMMALSLIAGGGMVRLFSLVAWQKAVFALYVITLGLLAVEFFPAPFPTTDLSAPKAYAQITADPGNFSVLSLPLGFNSGQVALGPSPIGSLQFYQVYYEKPSFRGTVARLPSWAFDYYRKLPLIKYFLNPSAAPDSEDLNGELVNKIFKEQLRIKYIVVHRDKYKKFPIGESEKLITQVLGAKKIFDEGVISTYQLLQ